MKYYLFLLLSIVCFNQTSFSQQPGKFVVPVAGNSWLINESGNLTAEVTNEGWRNWSNSADVFDTYIKPEKHGDVHLKILLRVPAGDSKIGLSINGEEHQVDASGTELKAYDAGTWKVKQPGYVNITAKGIGKTGDVFAEVESFEISGSAVDSNTVFVKDNEGAMFHFGRRGPSVHIKYLPPVSAQDKIEWFYNEITVPKDNDIVGSYFMADGFGEGYFGMQVNSETERRIIFSVWSPFNTDDPKEIPDDQKIVLLKKGDCVEANEFGNEGSGGHSHMVYPWKAGVAYRFLLHAAPNNDNSTTYTAYFFDPEKAKWLLVASFKRPMTHTWLTRLHSFLENFVPETGNITRRGYYHDQWIKTVDKGWLPINKMSLTADATARKHYRTDYMGGVDKGLFYLQNAGFFNQSADLSGTYEVKPPKSQPDIDLDAIVKMAQ